MEEIWKDIPGYEGLYQASNQGRIKSLPKVIHESTGKIKRQKERIIGKEHDDRYIGVTLTKNRKSKKIAVHRLIALTWLPHQPEGREMINHIDGNKHNNNPSNLEWCNGRENATHAAKTGLIKTKQVVQIDKDTGKILKIYHSVNDARKDFPGVSNVLYGGREIAGGYMWKIKEEI